VNIIECLDDPQLFKPFFEGHSWRGWRVVLKAAFGLKLQPKELTTFRQLCGDRKPPTGRVKELWICSGRRSGKDSIASLIAAFMASFFDGSKKLRRGERAQVQCLAVDKDQAKIVLGYTAAMFSEIPFLAQMVERETVSGFELSNSVDLSVVTNDYRSARGRTVLLSIFDECSFWPAATSASPDVEVYSAIKPGLMTVGGMIVGISTAHRKAGLLYDKWREHFGQDGDVLIVRAPSLALNPLLDAAEIAREIAADPGKNRAEYLSEWRDDISNFIDRALVEAAIDNGVTVRPRVDGVRYHGFVDPSGGVADSFTAAIAHREPDGKIILDHLIEQKAPFNAQQTVAEMCATLREYGILQVTGDRYAAQWVQQAFAANGIQYQTSARDRSAIYSDTVPIFTAGRARLLDSKRLVNQIAALERTVTPTGDKIDHPRHGADDLCNAACGALVLCDQRNQLGPNVMPIVISTPRVCYGDYGSGVDEYSGEYADGPTTNPAFDTSHWGKR